MVRARFGLILAVALCLASPLGHAVIVPPLSQPSWSELSAEQKRVLAPLSSEWDKMDGFRRKKWLGIAKRYQQLGPDEQARIQKRMTDWAKLTPEERKRARDKFRSLQNASPEKKEEVRSLWKEYKELPEDEKDRLKSSASSVSAPRPAPSKTASQPKPQDPAKVSSEVRSPASIPVR